MEKPASLVSVAMSVGVELQHVGRVVDAGDVAVEELGLDDVAELPMDAAPGVVAFEGWRPDVEGELHVGAVEGIVLHRLECRCLHR